MTRTFYDLEKIYRTAQNGGPAVKQLAIWLADLCIHDTDSKELGWTYTNWKNMSKSTISPGTEFDLKFAYLEECHIQLDHGKWHFIVFELQTQRLISLVKKAIVDNDQALSLTGLEKFPELLHFLKGLEYKVDPAYPSIVVKTKPPPKQPLKNHNQPNSTS